MQLHAQRSVQKPAFTHYKYHHISVFCVLRSHPLRYVCANCLALKLSYKWQDFWKMLWKKYVSVSSPPHFIYRLYETVLILLRFEQDIIKTAQTSSGKLPAIFITL